MTESEYLARLGRSLRKFTDADAVLGDFREHFCAGRAAGRTADEISATLGEPETIGREFLAVALAKKAGGRRSFVDDARLTLMVLADRYPRPAAFALGLGFSVIVAAALAILFSVATIGLGGLAQILLLPFRAAAFQVEIEPVPAAFALIGAGLLGVSGILAILAGVSSAGRKSGSYFLNKTGTEINE